MLAQNNLDSLPMPNDPRGGVQWVTDLSKATGAELSAAEKANFGRAYAVNPSLATRVAAQMLVPAGSDGSAMPQGGTSTTPEAPTVAIHRDEWNAAMTQITAQVPTSAQNLAALMDGAFSSTSIPSFTTRVDETLGMTVITGVENNETLTTDAVFPIFTPTSVRSNITQYDLLNNSNSSEIKKTPLQVLLGTNDAERNGLQKGIVQVMAGLANHAGEKWFAPAAGLGILAIGAIIISGVSGVVAIGGLSGGTAIAQNASVQAVPALYNAVCFVLGFTIDDPSYNPCPNALDNAGYQARGILRTARRNSDNYGPSLANIRRWYSEQGTLTTGINNITFRRPGTLLGMRTIIDNGSTVRMGRWMSEAEYDDMMRTGRIQAGSDGEATYVLLGGPDNFEAQARSGSVYIEFDLPANSAWWMTNDALGWATIPAPGSSQAGRWNVVTGQTIEEMPPVTNISDILRRK